MTEFTPTAEQIHARDLFLTGDSLAIEAGAGTGKTSTLILLAKTREFMRGQYVAFNKAIVTDAAAKMPAGVACNTAHSLAYRAVVGNGRTPFGQRLSSSKRMKGYEIARRLGLDPITLGGKDLSAGLLASIVQRAVTIFCQTADRDITVRHIPYQDGIDEPDEGARTYSNNNVLADYLLPFVRRAWEDFSDPEGTLPFRHDHYLKIWQLSSPRIDADYILFDEAQDANPVMVDIVAQQSHAQIVWVGDSNQQIYSFTGAVNALASVPAENRAYLTQSFRFGEAIAAAANHVLEQIDTPMRLQGFQQVESHVRQVDEPDTVLTRTNATAVRKFFVLVAQDIPAHIVGGGKEVIAFARAALDLMQQGRTWHPELACFSSWEEVQSYVKEDAQGDELKLNVTLVDTFGPQEIISALERMVPERRAETIISTAHKSKGREWDKVALAEDFASPSDERPLGPEEMRLCYVAITRAKKELDLSQVMFLAHLNEVPQENELQTVPQ
jgi:hypothetical protein